MTASEMEQIEAYLLGQMNNTERVAFQQRVEDEPELAKEIEQHQRLMEGVALEGARAVLEEVMDEQVESSGARTIPLWQRWQPYAAMAAVVLVIFLAWYRLSPPQPQDLYAAYYEPAPGLPTTLGTVDNPEFAEGMVAYKRGEYADAIQFWNPLLGTESDSDTLGYYLGLANLAEEEIETAVALLQQVKTMRPPSPFTSDATWYLGLAFLSQGNEKEARNTLEPLKDHPVYGDRVQELIGHLTGE